MNIQKTEVKAITMLAGMESYINKLQEHSDNEFQKDYPTIWANGGAPKYAFTEGKRFMKVVKSAPGTHAVFCFVDRSNGDIYKAAGWATPAKGVRGNIFNELLPLTLGSLYR